ncbi:DMT family transporter [Capnocytophaga canis]|uniref:DMT family transporter n=1 Tax=Capnocytophaga canis TaxID=1848903 RepID=UPI001562554C|nr:DMT family transporter [Capnocytophaga canis]
MSLKLKGYILALVSAITYGMIPLYMIPIKQSTLSLDDALFYRFAIGNVFILGFLIYRKERLQVNFRELLIFKILGLLYALSSEFLFAAYDYLTPGIASTIFFMYPIVVALILGLFFKEKITLATVISLLIVVLGVGFLSVKDTDSFSINFFGLFIGLMGAVIYGIYMIVVNKSKLTASGIKITFYSMLFSSIYFLVKSMIINGFVEIPTVDMGIHLTAFSLITTVLSILTLVYAIYYIGSTPTAIIGAVEPIVAVGISVFLFGELLTKNLIFGVLLIITGVLISILFERKKGKSK